MENKMLLPLKISNLHHAEMGQLAVRFFEDFASAGLKASQDADFKKLFNTLQSLLPEYTQALDQVQASEESADIAAADRVRDEDSYALKSALKPFRNARDEADKAAYHVLQVLFNQYKGVESNPYEEETLRLNNLLAALTDAANANAVTQLNMGKFVAQLQESNAAFNDLFSQRSNKVSQKTSYDLKAMRKVLEAAYRRLANYVATMADVKGDDFYTQTLAVLNAGRKYFSDTLARRIGNKKDDKKSEKK